MPSQNLSDLPYDKLGSRMAFFEAKT